MFGTVLARLYTDFGVSWVDSLFDQILLVDLILSYAAAVPHFLSVVIHLRFVSSIISYSSIVTKG